MGRTNRGNILSALVAGFLAGACAAGWLYFSIQHRDMPEPGFWQDPARLQPALAELAADDIGPFDAYLQHEQVLFAALKQLDAEKGASEPASSRFHPLGELNPVRYEVNWNRTTETPGANSRGGVVLLHGMTDSPYSLRTLADAFNQAGYYTLNLRLPGHGTAPGMLDVTDVQQFRAAVRMAMQRASAQVGTGKPLLMVGYSNGAALAVDYVLDALDAAQEQKASIVLPQKLILLSPALAVRSGGEWAFLRAWLGRLPGLEKVGWVEVKPELDPFKYNSFPAFAGQQVYELTRHIDERLQDLAPEAAQQFPPVLALVSVADSTVPAESVVSRLLERVPVAQSELVVFDINRRHDMQLLIESARSQWLDVLRQRESLPFALSVITNLSEESSQVQALRRAAGAPDWQAVELEGRWPRQVYSLSHVALPFRADDPFYGDDGSQLVRIANVGLRGEKNLFVLPPEQLMRMRYNPFSDYLQQKILDWSAVQ